MSSPIIIDTVLNQYIENHFGSYFSQTRNLHNDYWYIWAKSGLLNYVCEMLRSKYAIPLLDYEDDYINGEVSDGDFRSTTIESHQYYDAWSRKEEFRKELEDIVYQLRLHRSAFWFLFEKIFYDQPLDVDEQWSGDDSEALFHLTSPLYDEFRLQGFTSREIKKIKSEITKNFKNKLGRRRLTADEKQVIDGWCNQLRRTSRPPKDKEIIYQVIEQMKHYKRVGDGRDDEQGFASVRQTAAVSATELVRNLPDESISSKDFATPGLES